LPRERESRLDLAEVKVLELLSRGFSLRRACEQAGVKYGSIYPRILAYERMGVLRKYDRKWVIDKDNLRKYIVERRVSELKELLDLLMLLNIKREISEAIKSGNKIIEVKFSKVLHPLSLKVERENAVITVPKGVYEEYSCALGKIELHCVFKLMELVEYISMPVDDFLKMLGL